MAKIQNPSLYVKFAIFRLTMLTNFLYLDMFNLICEDFSHFFLGARRQRDFHEVTNQANYIPRKLSERRKWLLIALSGRSCQSGDNNNFQLNTGIR